MKNATKKPPFFSIITATYNSGPTVLRAFDSIAKQTFRDFEFIVVDGGSRASTQKVFQENLQLFTKFVSEKDRGISDALNKGVNLAEGKWILFCHSDDWLEPDALATLAQKINENPSADILSLPLQYWKTDSKKGIQFFPEPERLERRMSIPHPSTAVKRDLFQKIGNFDLSYKVAMDYDWMLRAKAIGAVFASARTTPIYNMSTGGVSHKLLWRSRIENYRAQTRNFGFQLKFLAYFIMDSVYVFSTTFLKKLGFRRP